MRVIALVVAILAAAISISSGAAEVSAAPAFTYADADEAVFVAKINSLRRAAGLSTLSVDHQLTSQARAWTATMAAADSLHHAGDLSVGVTVRWQVLGENVGVHSIHDLDALFGAFVNSPAHYANLVDPRYTSVGVGVIHADDGKIWTTHRFMALADGPAPTAPPSPPPPTAPPTTAPPTTARPTTAPPTSAPPTTTPPTRAPSTSAPPTTRPTSATATPAKARPTTTRRPTTAAPTTPSASDAPPSKAGPATSEPAATVAPTTSGPQSGVVEPEAIDVDLITALLIDLAESGL